MYMPIIETLPVIDLVEGRLDRPELEDTIYQVAARTMLGAQVQLFAPEYTDAARITNKDYELLEIVQRVSMDTIAGFTGFNACHDIGVEPGATDDGWHIDTLDDWLDGPSRDNSFSGMSANKTRVGRGTVKFQLGSTALFEECEWLLEACEDGALLAEGSPEEQQFTQFFSGPRLVGELVAGRWTLFNHGIKRLGQLPLWHLFTQPADITREGTAIFHDSATTSTSMVHFDGIAEQCVKRLHETAFKQE